jgi:hypothetical protein
MTVVLEDQVKSITAEISEQFGEHPGGGDLWVGDGDDPGATTFDSYARIEDVVRAVIAQYDISGIARLEVPQYELTTVIDPFGLPVALATVRRPGWSND